MYIKPLCAELTIVITVLYLYNILVITVRIVELQLAFTEYTMCSTVVIVVEYTNWSLTKLKQN